MLFSEQMREQQVSVLIKEVSNSIPSLFLSGFIVESLGLPEIVPRFLRVDSGRR